MPNNILEEIIKKKIAKIDILKKSTNLNSLNDIAKTFKKEILISTHPRTKKKIDSIKQFSFNPLIKFIKPLGFFDYINLQTNSLCTISDSGTCLLYTSDAADE